MFSTYTTYINIPVFLKTMNKGLTFVAGIATATEIKNAKMINDFILKKLKIVCRAERLLNLFIYF